jgi:hypothetical protein
MEKARVFGLWHKAHRLAKVAAIAPSISSRFSPLLSGEVRVGKIMLAPCKPQCRLKAVGIYRPIIAARGRAPSISGALVRRSFISKGRITIELRSSYNGITMESQSKLSTDMSHSRSLGNKASPRYKSDKSSVSVLARVPHSRSSPPVVPRPPVKVPTREIRIPRGGRSATGARGRNACVSGGGHSTRRVRSPRGLGG